MPKENVLKCALCDEDADEKGNVNWDSKRYHMDCFTISEFIKKYPKIVKRELNKVKG